MNQLRLKKDISELSTNQNLVQTSSNNLERIIIYLLESESGFNTQSKLRKYKGVVVYGKNAVLISNALQEKIKIPVFSFIGFESISQILPDFKPGRYYTISANEKAIENYLGH